MFFSIRRRWRRLRTPKPRRKMQTGRQGRPSAWRRCRRGCCGVSGGSARSGPGCCGAAAPPPGQVTLYMPAPDPYSDCGHAFQNVPWTDVNCQWRTSTNRGSHFRWSRYAAARPGRASSSEGAAQFSKHPTRSQPAAAAAPTGHSRQGRLQDRRCSRCGPCPGGGGAADFLTICRRAAAQRDGRIQRRTRRRRAAAAAAAAHHPGTPVHLRAGGARG